MSQQQEAPRWFNNLTDPVRPFLQGMKSILWVWPLEKSNSKKWLYESPVPTVFETIASDFDAVSGDIYSAIKTEHMGLGSASKATANEFYKAACKEAFIRQEAKFLAKKKMDRQRRILESHTKI